MKTFLQQQNEVKNRLSIAGLTASFFTDTTSIDSYIKDILNQGHEWVASFYDWSFLERALTASITAGTEYYTYPVSPYAIKTSGITRIEFGGKKYERTELNDYRDYKLDNSTDTDTYLFTDSQRMFFLFPTPTSSGTADVWAIIKPNALVNDGDTSLFYNYEPELDECAIKKAVALAFSKANQKQLAQAEEAEAMATMQRIYDRMNGRKKALAVNRSMFSDTNYFSEGSGNTAGKFSI